MIKTSFLVAISAVFLTACSNHKNFDIPNAQNITKDQKLSLDNKRFSAQKSVKDWWKNLDDASLNTLIEKGLEHNFSVQIAIANIQKSRALLGQSVLEQAPIITSGGNATRNQQSEYNFFGAPPNRDYTQFDVGLNGVWELDFFGRIENFVKTQKADYALSIQDLKNTYRIVASDIASQYVILRGAQHRYDVAKSNLDNQKESLRIVSLLVESGNGNILDQNRAQAQADNTAAQIPLLEAEIHRTINRLALLTGQTPDKLHENLKKHAPLPNVPASIHVGTLNRIFDNRPDVQSAKLNIDKAIAAYNIQAADLYPRVTLLGNVGFLSADISDIGRGGSSTYGFGPNISWAAFDMLRVLNRIDAADEDTKIAVLNYKDTVLKALEDIDNAMITLTKQEENREKLISASKASKKAADFAYARYDAGIDDFLTVLDSQRTALAQEDRLAVSETNLLLNVIAVYKALGL